MIISVRYDHHCARTLAMKPILFSNPGPITILDQHVCLHTGVHFMMHGVCWPGAWLSTYVCTLSYFGSYSHPSFSNHPVSIHSFIDPHSNGVSLDEGIVFFDIMFFNPSQTNSVGRSTYLNWIELIQAFIFYRKRCHFHNLIFKIIFIAVIILRYDHSLHAR